MNAQSFKVVIPSRYGSTRLPGKPLLDIQGKPMVQHVYELALKSGADEVLIATDDSRIETAAAAFGAPVCMTAASHRSGTERLAEVVAQRGLSADSIVVNVQGDEPLLPPELISEVANGLATHAEAVVATLATPLQSIAEWRDPNVVKAVTDHEGYALYFSRAPIPFDRDGGTALPEPAPLRHLGLYAYRASFLQAYSEMTPSPLESVEQLEQLRVLWNGLKIHVGIASTLPGPGVDTDDDLRRVAELLAG